MSVTDVRLRDALEDAELAFGRVQDYAAMIEMVIDARSSDPGLINEFHTLAAAIRHFAEDRNACLARAAKRACSSIGGS